MSVQTQIDRISGAVSDAFTALTEKGVTVPDGTKVDGLAALIAAIEAGGFSVLANGEFTVSDNAEGTYIIDTGLRNKDDGTSYSAADGIFLMWLDRHMTIDDRSVIGFARFGGTAAPRYNVYGGVNGLGNVYLLSGTSYIDFLSNPIRIRLHSLAEANYAMTLKAGDMYKWMFLEMGAV